MTNENQTQLNANDTATAIENQKGFNDNIQQQNILLIKNNAHHLKTRENSSKDIVLDLIINGETDINILGEKAKRTQQQIKDDIANMRHKILKAISNTKQTLNKGIERKPTETTPTKNEDLDLSFLIPNGYKYYPTKILGGNEDTLTILEKTFNGKKTKDADGKYLLTEKYSVLLTGDAGTGKTAVARYFAQKNKLPFIALNCNGGTTSEDFLGQIIPTEKGLKYIEGWLPIFMRNGGVLLIDEINFANADILAILQSVLDERRELILTQKDGDRIPQHDNFFCIATRNPTDYEGTKELNTALLDRFTQITIDVDSKIFKKLNLSEDIIAIAKRNSEIKLNVRKMIAYTQRIKVYGKETARELLSEDFPDKETKDALKLAFQFFDSDKDKNLDSEKV
jgi:hypothetical protein